MDDVDKKLLNLIQKGLPIDSKPFLVLANKLQISEEETINRIKALKNWGYIRRVGGIFDSKKLGYCTTLCALCVPEKRIQEVADIINSYDEVTHNYIRHHHYNMWFTIIAYSKYRLEEIIDNIKIQTQIRKLISLPSTKLFKINATFDLSRR